MIKVALHHVNEKLFEILRCFYYFFQHPLCECICACVCVGVCERVRERDRKKKKENKRDKRERERGENIEIIV